MKLEKIVGTFALVLSVGCFAGCGGPQSSDTLNVEAASAALQRDVWTTSNICEACGCTVSGFQCNCGLTPSKKKLACIENGGPSKVFEAEAAVATPAPVVPPAAAVAAVPVAEEAIAP